MSVSVRIAGVPFRSRHAEPIELEDAGEAFEWHLTEFELRDESGRVRAYRAHCGVEVDADEAILEPGRWGGLHAGCLDLPADRFAPDEPGAQ